MDDDSTVERFPPTSGRAFGLLAVAISVGVAVLAVVDSDGGIAWGGVALAVFFATLSWAALLRPRVAVERDMLVLRNMVADVRIPLAAIEEVVVRQVLAVRAGEKRYTSPAVGRSRRQIIKDDRPGHGSDAGTAANPAHLAEESYGLFVEERIRTLVDNARDQQGVELYSPEQEALATQVERAPAVPEIVVLAASALAFVVLVVV